MKNFFKDYWELCKQSGKFCKKHWLGVIICNIVILALYCVPAIIERLKESFTKKNDDEE